MPGPSLSGPRVGVGASSCQQRLLARPGAWGGGLGAVFSCGVVGSFVFQDGICMGKELGAGPGLPTCWLGAAR